MAGWNYVNPVESFMKGYKFWDDMLADRETRAREKAKFEYEQNLRSADIAAADLGSMVMREDGVVDPGKFNELLKDPDSFERIRSAIEPLPQFKGKKILGFAAEDMNGQPIGVVVTEDANGNRDIDAVRDPENPNNLVRITPELVQGVFANVSLTAGGERSKQYVDSRKALADERGLQRMINAQQQPPQASVPAPVAVAGSAPTSRGPALPGTTNVAPQVPSLQSAKPTPTVAPSEGAQTNLAAERARAASVQKSMTGSQAQAAQKQLSAAAELRADAARLRDNGLEADAQKVEAQAAKYEERAKQLMDFAAKRTNTMNPLVNPANYDTPEGIDKLIADVDARLKDDPLFTVPFTDYGVAGYSPKEKLELVDRRNALLAHKQMLLEGKSPDASKQGLNAAAVEAPRQQSVPQPARTSTTNAIAAQQPTRRARRLTEAETAELARMARANNWSPETLAEETRRMQGLPAKPTTTSASDPRWQLDDAGNPVGLIPAVPKPTTQKERLDYEIKVDSRIRDWSESRFGKPKAGETNPSITWAEGAARAAQREGILTPESPDLVDKLNRVTDMYIADTDGFLWFNKDLTSDQRYQSLGPGLVALALGETDLGEARSKYFEPAANIVGMVFKDSSAQQQQAYVYKTIDLAAALTQRGVNGQLAWKLALRQMQELPNDFAKYKVGDIANLIAQQLSNAQ
jgi:hypothetical protein